MRAAVGDRLVIRGRQLGEPDRGGEILEVNGANGAPPYLVRWEANGRVRSVFPGPDATIEHTDQPPRDGPPMPLPPEVYLG